jgi:hypothetical protein
MFRVIAATSLFVACLALPVGADMIPVLPPPGSEASHLDILDSLYGGSFVADGTDYVGGGASGEIEAMRYDDVLAPMGAIDLYAPADRGLVADAFWAHGNLQATATARYAGHTQRFGFDRGDGFEVLFDVSGHGTDVTGEAEIDLSGETWVWGRSKTNGANTFYSNPAANSDGIDHMVTYRITGLDTDASVWLLFWEDLPSGRSDLDYNDLVVEVRTIPEPASAALILLGSGGLMLRKHLRP